MVLYNEAGQASVSMRGQSGAYAVVHIGSGGSPGAITLSNDSGSVSIIVDGKKGDITFENGDCAEDFDLSGDSDADPGTVVTLGTDGSVSPSTQAYDTRVIGVVSGACGRGVAVRLGSRAGIRRRVPVALIGTVYCKVTAEFGEIGAGDLLVTSPVRGHAMCMGDSARPDGIVIGKALQPLRSGADLIPILAMLR